MVAFLAIFGSALSAYAGAPIWALFISVGILTATSLVEHRQAYQRLGEVGRSDLRSMAIWQSIGNAVLASGAAFAVGALSRLALLAS